MLYPLILIGEINFVCKYKLESINPIIHVGSVILYINGIHYDNIKAPEILKALLYRSCKIIYEVDVIRKCLQANSIYASRKGQ